MGAEPKKKPSRIERPVVKETDDLYECYRHLPPHQAEILKRRVFTPELQRGAQNLYYLCNRIRRCVAFYDCHLRKPSEGLQDYFYGIGVMTYGQYVNDLSKYVLYYFYLAIGEFIVAYICTVGFIYTGEHVSAKICEQYLKSCLRQNIEFFDKVGAGEITTRIVSDSDLIQDGITEKLSLTLVLHIQLSSLHNKEPEE